jgi:hypothetical protein
MKEDERNDCCDAIDMALRGAGVDPDKLRDQLRDQMGGKPPLMVKYMKREDDPLALRVSIGGSEEIGGYYFVYRGDLAKIKKMVNLVNMGLQMMEKEADLEKD